MQITFPAEQINKILFYRKNAIKVIKSIPETSLNFKEFQLRILIMLHLAHYKKFETALLESFDDI